MPRPEPQARAEGRSGGRVGKKVQKAWAWLTGKVCSACAATRALAKRAWSRFGQAVGSSWRSAGNRIQAGFRRATAMLKVGWLWAYVAQRLANLFRKPLLIAVGVGVAVGMGCYWAGPLVSSAMSGWAGGLLTLVAQAAGAIRTMLPDLAGGDLAEEMSDG